MFQGTIGSAHGTCRQNTWEIVALREPVKFVWEVSLWPWPLIGQFALPGQSRNKSALIGKAKTGVLNAQNNPFFDRSSLLFFLHVRYSEQQHFFVR
ncbi:hypothetical protein BOTNAR_0797g00040 [Botryotinia narcissicola]|uniref:Uncharacterized protein n=1 Tax=Botryotinia narcissicola TaxID=278944 RepID=A0A4Z1HAP8_9HELO|nr:hypothetical protein BOTNAR_0797g00040 [Botryotinia narcissicola]